MTKSKKYNTVCQSYEMSVHFFFIIFKKRMENAWNTKFSMPVKGLSWIQHTLKFTIGYWATKCSDSGSRISISNWIRLDSN